MNQNVKLVWVTPDAENLISFMARVSNPENQDNQETSAKLIKYLITHKHWSPFEMVSVCFEINAPRDISRQILRHKTIHFQEFSQRYQDVSKLEEAPLRECRLQDTKNRQNSLSVEVSSPLCVRWKILQEQHLKRTLSIYKEMLDAGVAKEVARAILPEGLTMSRMYAHGTLRSWLHFCDVRCFNDTQKETREIALQIKDYLIHLFPNTSEAFFNLSES